MENTVSDRCPAVSRSELICFCCERFAFDVTELAFAENVHVNTRAKGNPVKAMREGSIIFRFERPASRKSAECNRKTRRFGVFQRSQS